MIAKGLRGQYAGFVSRAVAFIGDLLLIVILIIVINASLRLPLDLFFGIDVDACPPFTSLTSGFQPTIILCHAAYWLQWILSLALSPVYFALFWTLGGQTPVQYAMGVRVVRVNGKRMTFTRALVRWLSYFVSFFALGLGYLWVLWDDRRQGFHDKIAGTVVVYAWEARQNEFLLDRIRQRLSRRKPAQLTAEDVRTVVSPPAQLEMVLAVFPDYPRLTRVIEILQDAVRAKEMSIINSIALVKDENGAVGSLGASDLAIGDESRRNAAIIASDPRLSNLQPKDLLEDVPDSSFALLIIVEDAYLSRLLKALTAAKAPTHVLDLDSPPHPPLRLNDSATGSAQANQPAPAPPVDSYTPVEADSVSASPPSLATPQVAPSGSLAEQG